MRALLLVLTVALLGSATAQAGGVALAVSLPDRNAMHRDFASGIVEEAAGRFEMHTPQLAAETVTQCSTDDACLLRAAKDAGAPHLLFIGVAAMGVAEFVVSVRLLDTSTGAELANVSALGSPGRDPKVAGSDLAKQAFAKVKGLPGPKPEPAPAPAPETAAPRAGYTGLSPVSLVGWSLAGLATASVFGGLGVGLTCQFADPATRSAPCDTQEGVLFAGGIFAGIATVGYGAGFGLVALDQTLLASGE